MKVKALKRYFVYTSSDIVTIPKEYTKLIFEKHNFLRSKKSNEVNFFRKACNELVVGRYLILIVMIPLQLQVTAI